MKILDLNSVTDNGKANYLSGKNKGLAVRKDLDVDQLDQTIEPVEVFFPNGFDCNESFLGGLLSNSISRFRTRAGFLEKYHFKNISTQLENRLNNVITATLSEGTALSSLRK